jgi:hypothetical protein
LRVEALEGRMMLAPVAALPFSVALLGQQAGFPPDPCIQFNPQPALSAALTATAFKWHGGFTEKLQETPAATGSTTTSTTWRVDVTYNLNVQPKPVPLPMIIVVGGHGAWECVYSLSGTARETLTPLDTSGNPVAGAQVWVSTDTISGHGQVTYVQTPAANPVASNNFTFSTQTTIKQTMALSGATAAVVWTANTTTTTAGTIVQMPSQTTISFKEQIGQAFSAGATATAGPAWTVSAELDGTETLPPAATVSPPAAPSGSWGVSATLSGTLSPPSGSLAPVRDLGAQVTAIVIPNP